MRAIGCRGSAVPEASRHLPRANAAHSPVTAHRQQLCACEAEIFQERVVPPAWNWVCVRDRGSRFPLNGSVYRSNAEAWQISRGRVSEVTNQTLPEPWGISFWENSEQSGPNPRKTVILSGSKPKKMFTPALPHKNRVLVFSSCQCSRLLAWKSWWRKSSASLLSHVSFFSRVVVIMGTSSESLLNQGPYRQKLSTAVPGKQHLIRLHEVGSFYKWCCSRVWDSFGEQDAGHVWLPSTHYWHGRFRDLLYIPDISFPCLRLLPFARYICKHSLLDQSAVSPGYWQFCQWLLWDWDLIIAAWNIFMPGV